MNYIKTLKNFGPEDDFNRFLSQNPHYLLDNIFPFLEPPEKSKDKYPIYDTTLTSNNKIAEADVVITGENYIIVCETQRGRLDNDHLGRIPGYCYSLLEDPEHFGKICFGVCIADTITAFQRRTLKKHNVTGNTTIRYVGLEALMASSNQGQDYIPIFKTVEETPTKRFEKYVPLTVSKKLAIIADTVDKKINDSVITLENLQDAGIIRFPFSVKNKDRVHGSLFISNGQVIFQNCTSSSIITDNRDLWENYTYQDSNNDYMPMEDLKIQYLVLRGR